MTAQIKCDKCDKIAPSSTLFTKDLAKWGEVNLCHIFKNDNTKIANIKLHLCENCIDAFYLFFKYDRRHVEDEFK